ncbi:uncharacterized protein LOC106656612, partial [Trichogramma pretiosum]|uniref:uncharacterized protein LOC106656612 n=1 Tax=Trichogramma pretiosum TaxID=7493 RepID=UPI0006C9DA4C
MEYGFCDLCINETENLENLRRILRKLYQSGYKTIALNQNFDENLLNTVDKKRKSNGLPAIPELEPIDITEIKEEFSGKLNILHRLTFYFSDAMRMHTLNQLSVLNKYDLYAIVPKTQAALQMTISQVNADIILINNDCSGIKLNRSLYNQAIQRNMFFEIQYLDVIRTNTRKDTMSQSHQFHAYGLSKNIFISSGASNVLHTRSTYDVVNLARVLGMDEYKAKLSILHQSHNVILKGEQRKRSMAPFMIEFVNMEEENVDN